MNMISELEQMGLELTEEQKTSVREKFGEEVITSLEHSKKTKKIESERDAYRKQYEDAKELLDGFEGKDFDAITKERDEWKTKAEAAETQFREELQKRDYADAVSKAVEGIKFSSNSAKKAFIAELEADPLKMKDGKLLGFDDYVKSYKESDASAFVPEDDGNKAQFTQQMGGGGSSAVTGDPNKMDFSTYKKWRSQNQ